jgi:hypothetical protein
MGLCDGVGLMSVFLFVCLKVSVLLRPFAGRWAASFPASWGTDFKSVPHAF